MSAGRAARDSEAATIISAHRTSQGLIRYRRWPGGSISVELHNGTADVLAWVGRTKGRGDEQRLER
jgi:hypothetical protein